MRQRISPLESWELVQSKIDAITKTTSNCDLFCDICDRRLAVIGTCIGRGYAKKGEYVPHKMRDHLRALNEADCCRWCARPITERGVKAAPDFIEIAKLCTGRQPAPLHPM